MSALTGQTREQLCASTAVDLVDPLDHGAVQAMVERALECPGVPVGREIRLLGARWARMHVIAASRPGHRAPAADADHRRLRAARAARSSSRHQADHDPLTELLNRRGFQRRLDGLLAEPGQARGAVMLLDLDHFKAVNDTLGHHIGDQVIRAAGRALQRRRPQW